MSKQTIQMITEAEAQAAEIIREARRRADVLYAETEQKSREDREQIEQDTQLRLRKMLEDMKAKSEEILKRSSESAQREAESMNKLAEFHMEEAVKAIVWGITEQCQ